MSMTGRKVDNEGCVSDINTDLVCSGRTGKMRVMSLKVGIATLSQARLLDKYICKSG